MMALPIEFKRELMFPLVIGPVDGILTALTLAAGRIVTPTNPIDLALATRIALAASLSGGFVFFVAEYARLRGELIRAEQHLNLTTKGRLAASDLGRDVLLSSLRGTLVAAVTGFGGALLPLATGALAAGKAFITIAVAIVVLGLLGVGIARAVEGNPLYWAVALMITGILLSIAGILLHVT